MRYEKPEMDIVEFKENVYMQLSEETENNFGTGDGGDY